MSESTPKGPTALLIIVPIVRLALLLLVALNCAGRGHCTCSAFSCWAKRKGSKQHRRSDSDPSADNLDSESGEAGRAPDSKPSAKV